MLLEEGVRVYKYSPEENAMAIVLEPKTSYNLISREESNNNKILIHVKLTDSCLRALEDYESAEVSSRRRPSIKFSGFHGVISIPLRKSRSDNDNRSEFQLNCSAIESDGRQGCMDCVQQPGDSKDIRTVGTITHKINVKATDDSYQMTQQRMKEAEEERKGVRTKVINTPSKGNKGVNKNVSLFRQRNSIMAAVKRKIKSAPPGAKVSNGPSKSVRERVVHLLAVRPYKKPELISRLNKDGVNLRDRNSLTGILQQVSVTTDNQYRLLKHLYSEVQVDTWPGYTETERQLLRRTISSHLNDNCLVTSSSSPPKNTIAEENPQTNKRSSSSKPLQASKRQRVAHINKNNNIVCDSVETCSHDNQVDSTEKDAADLKEGSPLSSVESSTTEHSINGENRVDTPEFMSKYKPITSYEQRAAYKQDFQNEYEEYKLLKELIDTVSTEFTALDEKRQQYAVESLERKAIEDKILELYKEKQKDSLWQERKKKCHDLHTKLSYIKQLITNYDKSTVHT